MACFQRPQAVEEVAVAPVIVEKDVHLGGTGDLLPDKGIVASIIGAILGQPRPVIVVAETAAQFESVFVRLWEELWPAARVRFSFCTGALMPRVNGGALLDLQAVPRAISP